MKPLNRALLRIHKHSDLLLPIGIFVIIAVILIPLPTTLMDYFLIANITLSAMILLTVQAEP